MQDTAGSWPWPRAVHGELLQGITRQQPRAIVFDILFSEPEEIQIGHGIAANLLGASALLPDSKVQQYVNQVGRWLSLHTERPDLPWQFGVLESTDINAFATPGARSSSPMACCRN
jgi:predicted Zn-dependent protease